MQNRISTATDHPWPHFQLGGKHIHTTRYVLPVALFIFVKIKLYIHLYTALLARSRSSTMHLQYPPPDSTEPQNLLKYRKVTRPGIEPRTFWTYTRCSNQLSYLALVFNQLILYLCNCQPKDIYSARHIQCHSLHARSTL